MPLPLYYSIISSNKLQKTPMNPSSKLTYYMTTVFVAQLDTCFVAPSPTVTLDRCADLSPQEMLCCPPAGWADGNKSN